MTSPLPPFNWDIFCCVVDNFGDIGVTWRLARQLKQEGKLPAHGNEVQVRLWVDDLASFAAFGAKHSAQASYQGEAEVRARELGEYLASKGWRVKSPARY